MTSSDGFVRWHAVGVAFAFAALPLALVAQDPGESRGRDASRATATRSHLPAGAGHGASAGAAAVASLVIEGGAKRLFVGSTVPHVGRVRDGAGAERRDVPVKWTSSNPTVASINQFGVLTAVRPGAVTVRAVGGGLSAERRYTIESNPVRSLTLSITADHARTGEVVEVAATGFDGNGSKVPNVPFLYTFTAAVEDTAAAHLAPAELDQRGRFVAQKAGDYQVLAVGPGLVAHRTIRVTNRAVGQRARVVARMPAGEGETVGLSVWRADGRDHLLACVSGARARAVIYDVSDAAKPRALDTVAVEARAIAECTVDPESRLAAVVLDGGPGARSRIALLDVSSPRDAKLLATYDDGLGTLRGVTIAKQHLYVVSDARRLDVISLENRARPRRVGTLELRRAGEGAADVTVSDGVAYVALGTGGVALVDVGSGRFGGTPARPVRIGGHQAAYASTHAAYAYRSRTGRWYVITSEDLTGPVARSATAPGAGPGFARVIDFTNPAEPEEVARYEVPEEGVEDLWVDSERLYVAARRGGLRVVDISADLKGSLYHQGREIARFEPADADGAAPNATTVVSAQPLGGTIFVADRHAGVWAVALEPRR